MGFLSWLFPPLPTAATYRPTPAPAPAWSMPVSAVGEKPPPLSRFDACLPIILAHEGGYVDHPKDPGGATNLGITHLTLADWRKAPVTREDVRELTRKEAGAIYRTRYWNAVRGDDLPAGLDLAMFDFAVNSGVGRASRELQKLLGCATDGAIGPQTLSALRGMPAGHLVNRLCAARLAFLHGLATWTTFGKGWERRVEEVRAAGLKAAV